MTSTEVVTRILLTVIIVGALSINQCRGASSTTKTPVSDATSGGQNFTLQKVPLKIINTEQPRFSLNSATPQKSSSLGKLNYSLINDNKEDDAKVRLLPDSAEAGILLPFDDDFPAPGGDPRRISNYRESASLPPSVAFPARPIPLRIDSGKALYSPAYDKNMKQGDKSYFLHNNCFGPRCALQRRVGDHEPHAPETWKKFYSHGKETKVAGKKYDDGVGNRLDNVLESMSSTFHSQIALPFVVVDDGEKGAQSSYQKRNGLLLNRPPPTLATAGQTITTEGWVKLKAMSPDIYDPFRFAKNESLQGSDMNQSTFSKRDSSMNNNNFSKRLGVELNPESFADRWGWSSANEDRNNNQHRGGSRLPAWLEEQLKFGNRKSDHGKNWVKLEPIPVAGVSISKWVPKGTPSHELPTTILQANRDRPGGVNPNPWWDRIDETRILNGIRPSSLRPGGQEDDRRYGSSGTGWNSKGTSSLSTFDRYPTNAWNDVIYPDGPTSATVSWQQSKGISNYPSSFTVGSGSSSGGTGWSPGGDTRKSIVATGSWSAPPSTNQRFPSFINRFSDHRPSSYPSKHANEEDPRWVLISNSRRVASGSSGHPDILDRNKILSYINRLHPDMDRRTDFPFYDSSSHNSHRHGKDLWPWPTPGSFPSTTLLYPSKDEAFHRVNSTLSTLTPVLIHRGGTTLRPSFLSTLQPSLYDYQDDGDSTGGIALSSTSPPMTLLSTFVGGARALSSNVANKLLPLSTSKPRKTIPGRIREGIQNINPVYAAIGAGMIPATLGAVMPMMLGKRKRRDLLLQSQRSVLPQLF